MAHRPFFSVVIPVYNRASLVRETIDSVLAQTFQAFELIVIDDGSNDGLNEVLQPYGPRLRLFRQENRGPGTARNLGIRHSRGEFIAFLDSDDLWFPWTLATYGEVLSRWTGLAVLLGSVHSFTNVGELAAVERTPVEATFLPDYFSTSRATIFRGSGASVYRRAILEKIGGFDESRSYCEDIDLLLRLGEAKGAAYVSSPCLLGRRDHSGGSAADIERTFEGTMRLFHKEKLGMYPGSKLRRRERVDLISEQAHAVVYWCIQRSELKKALALWFRVAGSDLRAGRLGFLAKSSLFFFLQAISVYNLLRKLKDRVVHYLGAKTAKRSSSDTLVR